MRIVLRGEEESPWSCNSLRWSAAPGLTGVVHFRWHGGSTVGSEVVGYAQEELREVWSNRQKSYWTVYDKQTFSQFLESKGTWSSFTCNSSRLRIASTEASSVEDASRSIKAITCREGKSNPIVSHSPEGWDNFLVEKDSSTKQKDTCWPGQDWQDLWWKGLCCHLFISRDSGAYHKCY